MRGLSISAILRATSRLLALLGVFASCAHLSVAAQVGVSTSAELANYGGPDRMEELVTGAKKEGTVVIYTSAPVEDSWFASNSARRKFEAPPLSN
jgi:hypothetical protein